MKLQKKHESEIEWNLDIEGVSTDVGSVVMGQTVRHSLAGSAVPDLQQEVHNT